MFKRLGDIASFRRGLTYSKGDEAPLSNKRVLRSNNIDLESSSLDLSEIKYLREDFIIPDDRKLVANSIFICMSNGSKQHVGKVAFIPEDMDYAFGGFMGLIVPSSEVSAKYVFYACQSSAYRSFLSQVGNGIGITNLRFSDLEKFEFPVPSLADQQSIVAELDLLSGIVEKKNAQLRTLERLAESLFIETFGNLIANDRNWRMGTLNEFIEDKKRILRATKFYKPDEVVHYIDISSIDNKAHSMTSTTELVFNEAPSRAQQIVQNGDVLVSMVRPNLRNVAIVSSEDKNLVASSGFCVLRSLSSNGEFLKQLVLSDFFTDYLLTRVSGANYPAVREEDIKECKLGIPPAELQLEFSNTIKALETERLTIDSSLKTTQDLLASRMDKYFSA